MLSETISDMLLKIVDGDNTGAKEDFENIISQKLNDALDAKRMEIAQAIYGEKGEESEESESQESEEEEETADATEVE